MSRYHSYINSAREILNNYGGEEPFASFLKKYFSANKKYGSKDRKQISHLCYCYFRTGKMGIESAVEERILAGLFICSGESNEILLRLKPEWNEHVSLPLNKKLSWLYSENYLEGLFPWADELCDGIDAESFILSHLEQPGVFLRLRPGKEEAVKEKLKNAGIDFQVISRDCLSLPNASKIDKAIELNKEAVVQDYSSQRVGEYLQSAISPLQPEIPVWDCCAGSGGKSIMLYDLYPGTKLTVSDIRGSILINLKKRFSEAGIKNYHSFIIDLLNFLPQFPIPNSQFHLILCDIPCTGSGTWGRTPEQLYYFDKKKIEEYAVLQKKIVSNVLPYLKPGGHFLYITCSVYKKENEAIVDFIKENFRFQLIKSEVLKGYDKKADTMFAALLQKTL
jgi:16S rRNA (cytosine967-C5)-methyltransferase